ncbi:hypothetical protein EV127DRAFT_407709 [Xylaria flabelliformis]|nr:hypothetical protein EV127DRAFT_407709 [Xylaria flabelliformis]
MSENADVPAEEIMVAKFDTKIIKYAKRPDAVGWIVKKEADRRQPFRFRFLPKERDLIHRTYPTIPIKERQSDFLQGHPLLTLATPIHTCGAGYDERPRILYRLTHEGQPHRGRKPRGHGFVDVGPFSFHILFHKHLDWRCRNPSPFLSATDDMEKIHHIYGIYEERGYQNIQLIKFRTYGPGWDHQKQRLYRVYSLLEELGGRSPQYVEKMAREFIIEGEIPRESIIEEGPFESDRPRRPAKEPRIGVSTRSTDDEERVLATEFTSYI